MNKLHTLSMLLFLSNFLYSQERIPVFDEDSIYMYNAVNLSELDSYKISVVSFLDLSEPVATYAITDTMPALPRGHYWQVMKQEGKVLSKLYTKDNLYNYTILRETKKPELLFYDNNGNPLKDISVHYQNKLYKSDSETCLIRLSKISSGSSELTIFNSGVKYELRLWNNGKAPSEEKLTLSNFIKPDDTPYIRKNEIEYKYGDTIPVNVNVNEFDSVHFYTQSKKLLYSAPVIKDPKQVNPQINSIILKKECPYLKEGRVIVSLGAKSQVYNESLRLAEFEYVIRKYNLSATINTRRHLRNQPPVLSLKVTEQNDEFSNKDFIEIKATTRRTEKAWCNSVFVPEVLFHDTIPLEINKDLNYILPQKYFPCADIAYKLEIYLYRNNRLAAYRIFEMKSIGNDKMFKLSENKYMLNIEKIDSSGSLPGIAVLDTYGEALLSTQKITLPYSGYINPIATYYKVSSGNLADSILIKNNGICPIDYNLQPMGKDSVTISLYSPSGYPFWYTVMEKGKVLKRGYNSQAQFNLKNKKDGDYILLLEYMYGGKIQELQTKLNKENYNIFAREKKLSYNTLSFYNNKKADWKTNDAFDGINGRSKPSKYEETLNLLDRTGTYYYLDPTSLYLSFRNEEKHRARYVMLVDSTKADPYDRLEVYKAGRKGIQVSAGKSYSLYVLSDSTLVHKQTLKTGQKGYYLLSLDMDKLNYSPSLNKEVTELITPFTGSNFLKIQVFDSQMEPAIGAAIKLSNASISQWTDIDGIVIIKIPSGFKGNIDISYLGMKNKRVEYRGQPDIKVYLEEDYILLE
jgi:hypothetical protein